MRFTKILCATDFSEGAQHAVRVALRIAREHDADLVLTHSWYIPPASYSIDSPLPGPVIQSVIDDAESALAAAVAEAKRLYPKVTGELGSGVPWLEIVTLLENQAFDLCVIGTHGRTGLPRILLGSVAQQVIRHAPCSVLAVRPDSKLTPFHHALVPTDFSDSAKHALDLAVKLVEPPGSISLVHVIEAPVSYAGKEPVADFAAEIDRRATAALEKEAERADRETELSITARSRIGFAGAQILAAIEHDPSLDLVVMGSHGRTGIRRMLLGSVAEKVVRHAHCPVLVARKRS